VNSDGQYLYRYYSQHTASMDYNDYVAVEFGGALGALLFYVSNHLSVASENYGKLYVRLRLILEHMLTIGKVWENQAKIQAMPLLPVM